MDVLVVLDQPSRFPEVEFVTSTSTVHPLRITPLWPQVIKIIQTTPLWPQVTKIIQTTPFDLKWLKLFKLPL